MVDDHLAIKWLLSTPVGSLTSIAVTFKRRIKDAAHSLALATLKRSSGLSKIIPPWKIEVEKSFFSKDQDGLFKVKQGLITTVSVECDKNYKTHESAMLRRSPSDNRRSIVVTQIGS